MHPLSGFSLALLTLTTLASNSSKEESFDPTAFVVGVSGKGGLGHACPISPTLALTAGHVVYKEINTSLGIEEKVIFVVWESKDGEHGRLSPRGTWSNRDLAMVVTDIPFPGFYVPSPNRPKVGDAVYLVGYDHKRRLERRVVRAKITSLYAGLIIYDDTPGPGSSGSCVVNEAGQLLGVNFAGGEDEHGRRTGIATSVYGTWLGTVIEQEKGETPNEEPSH